MMHLKSFLNSLEKLGQEIREYCLNYDSFPDRNVYDEVIRKAYLANRWFIPEFTKEALKKIGGMLEKKQLEKWLSSYPDLPKIAGVKTVGLVLAGNLPLVGFHDFLSVLASGHQVLVKLSSEDKLLLPFLKERLIKYDDDLRNHIRFTDDKLTDFDAVIATGSNNTARYFEYYFGKYPHIIRKNRNGTAVLTGEETESDLLHFAEDVFLYFGKGCRSVSKLFVPEDYDFSSMFKAFEAYKFVRNTSKYINNYDYYRSIYLINKVDHLDNGFIMITESDEFASPPSVLYFERYKKIEEVKQKLINNQDKIQTVVSISEDVEGAIAPGTAQGPALWDYADGVDTMSFLSEI